MERFLPYVKALPALIWSLVGLSVFILLMQISATVQHFDQAAQGIAPRTNVILDRLDGTLENLNRPCKGPAGPDACGTLAQINKAVIDAGDATIEAQLQVKQSGKLIDASAKTIAGVGEHLEQTADSLTGTANAATAALAQAHDDLATANASIAASKPLLDAATLTVTHLDETRANLTPNLERLLAASADATTHGAAILADGQIEADKYAHPLPQRWYQKIYTVGYRSGELLYDFIR